MRCLRLRAPCTCMGRTRLRADAALRLQPAQARARGAAAAVRDARTPHPPPARGGLRRWMQPAAEELTRSASELDARAQARRRADEAERATRSARATSSRRSRSYGGGAARPRAAGSFHSSDELGGYVGFMLGHIERQHARTSPRSRRPRAPRARATTRPGTSRPRAARGEARSAVTGFPGTGGGGRRACSAARARRSPAASSSARVAGRRESDALREQGPSPAGAHPAATSSRHRLPVPRRGSTLMMAQQARTRAASSALAHVRAERGARARETPSPLAHTTPPVSSRQVGPSRTWTARIDSRAQRGSTARATQQRQAAATMVSKGRSGGLYTSATTTAARAPARLSASRAPVAGRAARESNVLIGPWASSEAEPGSGWRPGA